MVCCFSFFVIDYLIDFLNRNFNYEDFCVVNIIFIFGCNRDYFDYGIVVLGQMFMVDN